MNFIQFLFKLLHRFNLMGEDYGKTKEEAELWYAEIKADKDSLENPTPEDNKKFPLLIRKAKAQLEKWYGKVALAILYIFLVRWIHEYMNPEDDEDEDDEE